MKALICLMMLLSIPAFAPALANEREGHGAGVVKKDGKLVPADLYYAPKGYKIPDTHKKFDIKSYPGLEEEMSSVLKFINLRGSLFVGYPRPPVFTFDGIDLYTTDDLSGVDEQEDVDDLQYQVGFAFVYNEEKLDLSVVQRRVVEIKDSLFRELSPRHQTLILVHELLHHLWRQQVVLDSGHKKLSTFVKVLNMSLQILDRQKAADLSPLTDQEHEVLTAFGTLLGGADQYAQVHRNGGGIVRAESCDLKALESTFIDPMSAVIMMTSVGHLETCEKTELVGNRITNSKVRVYQGASIRDSSILNSSLYIGGQFRGIRIVDSNPTLQAVDKPCVDSEFIRVKGSWITVKCEGTGHRLQDLTTPLPGLNEIKLTGSGASLQRVKVNMSEVTLSTGASISDSELECVKGALGAQAAIAQAASFPAPNKTLHKPGDGTEYYTCGKSSNYEDMRVLTLASGSAVKNTKFRSIVTTSAATVKNSSLDVAGFAFQPGSASQNLSGLNLVDSDGYYSVTSKESAMDFAGKTYKPTKPSTAKDPIKIKSVQDFEKNFGTGQ